MGPAYRGVTPSKRTVASVLVAQERTARISETEVFTTPTGQSFIFADIAEFAWNASRRGRGGRSNFARRAIHRP